MTMVVFDHIRIQAHDIHHGGGHWWWLLIAVALLVVLMVPIGADDARERVKLRYTRSVRLRREMPGRHGRRSAPVFMIGCGR